ncbi:hypothetical protein GL267_010180 [Acidithiobacillus ferrianus]|uniref:ATP-binding protein n=2 Tax=Acidithiobacillus ferrianus TaxID=2678518 RepID=A0A845ULU2_9PROT|nr:hypothetical protein [Acidithiobacillus ferrianus]NDU42598.1 hypothetical protein [Acidithiobacillus ferrianus]
MLSADDIDEQVEATEQDALTELLEIAKDGDAPGFWRAFKTRVNAVQQVMADDPVEYAAWRAEVKTACSKINVSTLDALVNPKDGDGSDSQATQLASLASEKCELWHDAEGDAFASLERDNHREHWRIDSVGFRDWLSWIAHSELGAAPSSETLKSACNALSGTAKFDGDEHEPRRRVGKDSSGYWLDVGDDHWRAILITATGWRIMNDPPVRFIRTKATRALPEPVSGGSVDVLWHLVNVPKQERLLVLAWIIECFRPDTPYALLELTGEQGAAKSTAQRTFRRFIDPNQVELRGKPKAVEDIYVSASNSHLLSYENLSGLSNDQSDALCTCCTGGGYAARQLYTNGEESTLTAHCPVALNGISPVVLRPDLLDRAVSITLPEITVRKTDDEIREATEAAARGIMGALLDLFSNAMALIPSVVIPPEQRPRMADFAMLGEAIARVQGYTEGDFLALYTDHRRTAIGRTIDASPVAAAMVAYVDRGNRYVGTVKGLLEILTEHKPDHERDEYWPRSPKGLADAMRRYAPALRQMGIIARVDNTRRKDGVHCVLHVQAPDYSPQPQVPGNEVHQVHQVHPSPKPEPEPCPQCGGSGCPLCWDTSDDDSIPEEI